MLKLFLFFDTFRDYLGFKSTRLEKEMLEKGGIIVLDTNVFRSCLVASATLKLSFREVFYIVTW